MAKGKVAHLFTVTGSGDFPADMLRYDMCWPYRSEDSSRIQATTFAPRPERRSIVMQTYAARAPTTGRWHSFGWDAQLGADLFAKS